MLAKKSGSTFVGKYYFLGLMAFAPNSNLSTEYQVYQKTDILGNISAENPYTLDIT